MMRILFVTNGHGEAAIAKRISAEVRALGPFSTDHFPLVGAGLGDTLLADVGPRRAMPSGGLVAMGNVRAFAADARAGFFPLLGAQVRFLGGARSRYLAVVAVGDVYALLLSKFARLPTIFVGTAKSAYVAPYGPLERRVLRTARRCFVRDAATARELRARGVPAEAPGNVIVDLLATAARVDWHGATVRVALLPGSRDRAYADAGRLADVVRRVMARTSGVGAVASIAPGIDAARLTRAVAGEPPIETWPGDVGAVLTDASLAIGQAGTANEAAAACGVPVVALDVDGGRRPAWYRMRQARLLGDALAIVPSDPDRAATAIANLLADGSRRAYMAAVGRERMGAPGGAAVIARAISTLASSRAP